MINIAALGLYMLLTSVTNNPAVTSAPIIDNSNTPVVQVAETPKKESANPIDKNLESYVRNFYKDTPILAEVARCESHFTQFTASGRVLRGIAVKSDVGIMQINEVYHLKEAKALGMDIYSLDGNLAFGKYLYEKNGARDWLASSPCWGKVAINEKSNSSTQTDL